MLNFNESRSHELDAFSSNINALAESIDCGLRLFMCDETLFCRCVIMADVVGFDDAITLDVLGLCYQNLILQ